MESLQSFVEQNERYVNEKERFARSFATVKFLVGPPAYSGATTATHYLAHSLQSQVLVLPPGTTATVGRHRDCDLRLPNLTLFSRNHAKLIHVEEGLEVMNISGTGTFLGGAPYVKDADESGYVKLHQGDSQIVRPNAMIRFGPTLAANLDDAQSDGPDLNMPWLYLEACGLWSFIQRNTRS